MMPTGVIDYGKYLNLLQGTGAVWADGGIHHAKMAGIAIPVQASRSEDKGPGDINSPQSPMSIAVLIADDHELLRLGLRGALESNGFWVVAEAATPLEAVTYALDPRVQVVLLDLSWTSCPNAARDEGLRLLRAIRSAHPTLPILMYSVETGSECIERCRCAGASGYLIKGVDDAVLGWAVRAVHAGEQIWLESQHIRPPVQPAHSGSSTLRR